MEDFADHRARMVAEQIARRGVRDQNVLDAMRAVPREAFVAPAMAELAYQDGPLPIGAGQTISQPYVVALMIEAAGIQPGDRVLEVGAGSGYVAAVVSRFAGKVCAIERHPSLCGSAREVLDKLGCRNVHLRVGDGTTGWPEEAPFDAVLVSAGGPIAPQALKEQLAIGGRLVIPVGGARDHQRLLKITRNSETRYDEEDLGAVSFVPLLGAQGWAADEAESATDEPGP